MIRNFGENLKNLRKKKDLTQDEIAEILNVSTQTVSRWETNMGYPDIEMLPAIANFYGVTVDSLLGLDIDKKKEKIAEIIKLMYQHKTKGEIDEAIEICEKGLKEFPNDSQLLNNLALCLYNHGSNEDEKKKNNEKVKEICENILKDCNDDPIRHSSIQLLCYTYPLLGKQDLALEMAGRLPGYYVTANELITQSLHGEEKKQHIKQNLLSLLQIISNNTEELFLSTPQYETKIAILQSLLTIYRGFFDKEDYYFFHCRIHRICRYMAAVYADHQKYDETIEYIEKAAGHAIAYDTRPEEYQYTSSVFEGVKDSASNSVKNTTSNYCRTLLDKLSGERYDFIRNDPKIRGIMEKLNQYATVS